MKKMRNSKLAAVLDLVMKSRKLNNEASEPQLDENDPVWQLLAESPRPKPDAWFAVRTVARCRNAGLGLDFLAFRGIWRWALGGGLGVCLAIFMLVPHPAPPPVSSQPDQQKNVQEAFEIMASMDTPPDSSSSSSSTTTWQDSSL